MRRAEFLTSDEDILAELCEQRSWGTLALLDGEGSPLALPMNHAYGEGIFVFHGIAAGRKADALVDGAEASYSVVEELAYIPTNWAGNNDPCSATQFFRSVEASGNIELIRDFGEKARYLELLVNQRETAAGGTWRHSGDWPQPMLKATTIWILRTNKITGKFKLGQNLNKDDFDLLCKYLLERGSETDLRTVSLMKKFHP